MDEGILGKKYADGEIICHQEEPGDRMFIIQSGRAVVLREEGGSKVVVGELTAGDIFGEMAILDGEPRCGTVQSQGTSWVLTLDRRGFLRKVHEDPSLVFRILQQMSRRIRNLDQEISRLKSGR